VTSNYLCLENDSSNVKLIALALIAICLMGITDAKMPKVGDHVKIVTPTTTELLLIYGEITDIGNGLICLNSPYASIGVGNPMWTEPKDVAIGTGQIVELFWLTDEEFDFLKEGA